MANNNTNNNNGSNDLRSLASTIHTDDSNIYSRSMSLSTSQTNSHNNNDSASSLMPVDGVPVSRVRQLESQLLDQQRETAQLQDLLDQFLVVPTNPDITNIETTLKLQEKVVALKRHLEERHFKRELVKLKDRMTDESLKSQQTQDAQHELLKSQEDLLQELREALELQVQTVAALQDELAAKDRALQEARDALTRSEQKRHNGPPSQVSIYRRKEGKEGVVCFSLSFICLFISKRFHFE